jgi:hypothetical protein
MHRYGLDLSSSESDDDKTMLKEMRARQEYVAINSIHNNSTLSAGSIMVNQPMKRPRIYPIHLPSITKIGTMMRVVAKMIKSGLSWSW